MSISEHTFKALRRQNLISGISTHLLGYVSEDTLVSQVYDILSLNVLGAKVSQLYMHFLWPRGVELEPGVGPT